MARVLASSNYIQLDMDQRDMSMEQGAMTRHSLGIDRQSMYLAGIHSLDTPDIVHHSPLLCSFVAHMYRHKWWLTRPVCIHNQ
jgi:hypothetical protein